jgi:hypothetical protein
MKSLKFVVFGIVALAVPSIAAAETMTCTPEPGLLGAPSYKLVKETNRVALYKVPLNPTVRPILIASSTGIIRYGNTTIFVANYGRSGYAFLFSNTTTPKPAAVIDINLFQHQEHNTNGALTKYKCKWGR